MLQAALELVAEKGTVRVTLAEIGERAKYSRGLPAHHFGSKANLLAVLARFINERFAKHRLMYPAQRGLKTVEAVIHAYFTRDDPNWTATRALIIMMAEGTLDNAELRSVIVEYNRESLRYVAHHIGLAQRAGEARSDVDPQTLAVLLLSTFRGAMLQHLNDSEIKLVKVRDELLAMVRQHLRLV